MLQKQTNKSWLPVQFLSLNDRMQKKNSMKLPHHLHDFCLSAQMNLLVVMRPGGQKKDLGLKAAERFGEKLVAKLIGYTTQHI